MPVYMLAEDIQKLVTSMLAKTDTPIMAHRPVGKEREIPESVIRSLFLKQCMLKRAEMNRIQSIPFL